MPARIECAQNFALHCGMSLPRGATLMYTPMFIRAWCTRMHAPQQFPPSETPPGLSSRARAWAGVSAKPGAGRAWLPLARPYQPAHHLSLCF